MNPGDELIGRTFSGKYEILSLLGKGGMGAVYHARQTFMDREVALKVLSISEESLEHAEEYLARFKREARTASLIKHPSAITIFDYGVEQLKEDEDSEVPYLVMELIRGRSLKAIIEEGPMAPKRVVELMTQVCGALQEAHELGIVHRDMKPDNIMVSRRANETEWPHVLDFGIAKVLSDQADTGMTRTGVLIGTPRYMSPEQVLSKEIGPGSDIYSVGVILYQMLSGSVPFSSNSFMEVALKHVNEAPQPLRERVPELGISPELEAVVMKALEKGPGDRQASARELARELMAAVPIDMPDPSLSFSAPLDTGLRKAQKKSALPLTFIAGCVLVLILGLSAHALLRKSRVSTGEPVSRPKSLVAPDSSANIADLKMKVVEPKSAVVATPVATVSPQVTAVPTVTTGEAPKPQPTPAVVLKQKEPTMDPLQEEARRAAIAEELLLELDELEAEPKATRTVAPTVARAVTPAVTPAVAVTPEVAPTKTVNLVPTPVPTEEISIKRTTGGTSVTFTSTVEVPAATPTPAPSVRALPTPVPTVRPLPTARITQGNGSGKNRAVLPQATIQPEILVTPVPRITARPTPRPTPRVLRTPKPQDFQRPVIKQTPLPEPKPVKKNKRRRCGPTWCP
jgi:serine/threonine protein kinase